MSTVSRREEQPRNHASPGEGASGEAADCEAGDLLLHTKADLLFSGVRYTTALEEASARAIPNFYPYRFAPGEASGGRSTAPIPYLMTLAARTMVRLLGNPRSPYRVERSHEAEGGDTYLLMRDEEPILSIDFQPRPRWQEQTCQDGTPMDRTGVSLHGDMAVINLAPACQYHVLSYEGAGGVADHLAQEEVGARAGRATLRCRFCLYGAPGPRSRLLQQEIDEPAVPDRTMERMLETLAAVLADEEQRVRHVYVVAGCMADQAQEAQRYAQIGEAIRASGLEVPFLTCGSGALSRSDMDDLHRRSLYDAVCFNLEVWSHKLFRQVCPGKERHVGYAGWLDSLYHAASVFGPGRVYTAMVSGIELEPPFSIPVDEAVENALEGAAELLRHGVVPIHSLYWPFGSGAIPERAALLRSYFWRVGQGSLELRRAAGLPVAGPFMCPRCAYMQLDPDFDQAGAADSVCR